MNPPPILPRAARLALQAIAVTLLTSAAAAGCHDAPDLHAEQREAGEGRSFTFVGGEGSSARVTLTRSIDGRETLHGETIVALGANAERCVVEDVTLDPKGRLARAEIKIASACDGAAEQRISLDASTGDVRSITPYGIVASRAPTDAPWVYAPPASIVTPIAAWVVARAAAGAGAVRYVDPLSAHVPLVPRSQVAVETERGLTVIVGNDGAEVDDAFVRRVQWLDHGVTLVRVPQRAGGANGDQS